MDSKIEKGKRFREVRIKLGLTQTELADKLEISQSAIGRTEKGLSSLKASNLKKLTEEYGVSIDYIEKGTGPIIESKIENKGLSRIELVSGSVLAGLSPNSQVESHTVEDTLYLPLGEGKQYYAIRVEGRSMEPKISEGSILILDEIKEKSGFINNKIYVIIFQGVAFVKRVRMLLGGADKGKFEVSSDNEEIKQIVEGDDVSAWYRVTHVINQV